MKILPELPQPNVASPYAGDLFGREKFGKSLQRLIGRIEDRSVICLDEPWGMGKTTFIRMWVEDLRNQKIEVINFNAFESQGLAGPLLAFTSEIDALLRLKFPNEAEVTLKLTDFKSTASSIGRKLLFSALRTGLKIATSGLVDLTGIGGESLNQGLSTAVDDTITQELDEYSLRKKEVARLKSDLAEIAVYVKERQNFPLLIIIDELDRCSPEYSLQMLEQIAHFFEVPNLVFLLPCNLSQIANHVSQQYGSQTDGQRYLQKFFNIRISFPKRSPNSSESGVERYLQSRFQQDGLTKLFEDLSLFGQLASFYSLSYREIDQICSLLKIYSVTYPDNRVSFMILNIFLCIIKVKYPETFGKVLIGQCSYSDLLKETRFLDFVGSLKYRGKAEFLEQVLMYHFFSEEEYKVSEKQQELSRFDQRYFMFSIGRREVTRIYCEDISSFVD